MLVLGIESSCDETAAAVYSSEKGLLSNVIASQSVHEQFGGVVPELASRAHQQSIWSTVEQSLTEANCSVDDVDVVAVTQGPGLLGSLLVGFSFAKGLALSHNKKLVGVNHMDAHIYANWIDHQPEFPVLSLTVSGGHTQLMLVKNLFDQELLGETRDDASGEAFDKIGNMLGLDYPAGPRMDKHAQNGNPKFVQFPVAHLPGTYEFSFSGLKTAVLYHIRDQKEENPNYVEENRDDLCASVSEAITKPLIKKLDLAIKEFRPKSVVLAGGVSANTMLREKAKVLCKKRRVPLYIPHISYCTDNAAMIAITGYLKASKGLFDDFDMKPFARL